MRIAFCSFSMALLIVTPGVLAQAVYVPNYTTSNISAYLMDPSSGVLSAVAGSPVITGTSPIQALVHPSGKFLYVLDSGSGDISLYAVNAPSGALSFIVCPLCATVSPSGMAMDPTGQFLFVTNSKPGTVTPYRINAATGALTIGAPASTGIGSNPVQPTVDPAGRYLYVADSGTGQVSGFAINPGGYLTAIPGSPFAAGSGPQSIATSRTAVFVANQYSADVSVYQIGAGGTLLPAGPAVPVGGSPLCVAVDPSGSYLYVTNQVQLVAFSTVPDGVYPLSQQRSYNAGATPSAVVVDQGGNYVYAASFSSSDISGFAIAAGGRLVPLGKSSVFGAAGPKLFAVHHIGDTTAISVTAPYPLPAGNASYGTPVEFKGIVKNTLTPATTPRGSVTFTVNGGAVANGTISLDASGGFDLVFDASTQYLPIGANVIQIAYNPGTGFEAPVPVAVAYTVTKATPGFNIAFSPASPIAAQPMTITVSAQLTGGRYPTGAVTFSVDGSRTGSAITLTNGSGSVSYTPVTGDHGIKLDYGGDICFNAISAGPVNFHARHTTTTNVTSNPTSPVYGQAPTLTATVSGGAGAVTGTVDYYDGATQIGTAPVLQTGGLYISQLSTFTFATVGQHSVTAVYSGDANNVASNSNAAPLVLTVAQDAVNVSTPLASGTQTYGQPLTFTATVTAAAPGAGTPGGTMTFKDNGVTLGTSLIVKGAASFAISTLSAAAHTITASYGGDTNFLAGNSASGVQVAIAPAAPQLNVAATPASPVVYGQQVILSATLSGPAALTGTVDFSAGSTKLGSVAVSGNKASLSYIPSAAGSFTVTAIYNGDANNSPASSSMMLVVNQSSVNVSTPMISSVSGAAQSTSFTVAVTVSAAVPGGGTPGGTVTFKDGTASLGTVDLTGGIASFTMASLTPGTHSITASYSGDANFTAGTSAAASLTTTKLMPALTLTADPGSPVSGQMITLTATVGGSAGLPCTGTVDLLDNGMKLNPAPLAVSGGQAQLAFAAGGAGVHAITAFYSGDANCNTVSNSAGPLSLTVNQAWANVSTPTISGTTRFGQQVTFTVAVSAMAPGNGTPTGILVFKDGATPLGSAALSGGGAQLTTSNLTAGTHWIQAAYGGDANFTAATSAALTFTQDKAATTTLLSAAQTNGSTLLRATVNTPGTGLPTGSVQFLNGTTVLANVPLTTGTATLQAGELAGLISATYSGDDNFYGSGAAKNLDAIAKPTTSLTLKISPNPATASLPITFTVNLAWSGSATPGGMIQLYDGSTVLASAMPSSQVNFTMMLNAGSHNIRASYTGDGTYPSNSMNTVLAVSRSPGVTLALGADIPAPVFGQAVRLAAKFGGSGAGITAFPAGQVQFVEQSTLLGNAPLTNGVATLALSTLAPGTHQITALYSGDAEWLPMTSNAISVTISKAFTVLAISAGPGVPESDQVTVTARLSVELPGSGAPTGTVQFLAAGTGETLGTAMLDGGTASLPVPVLQDSSTILAVYDGDERFRGSSSAPIGQFSILNSASNRGTILTPDEMVTVFSPDMTKASVSALVPLPDVLGGVTLTLIDSAGDSHRAHLLYVSPAQLNFLVPGDTALGPATLQIATAGGAGITAAVYIGAVSPGLFTANARGQGVAAAQVIRVHADGSQEDPQSTASFDSETQTWTAVPIDVSSPTDDLYLVLYATGIRHESSSATVTIGGEHCPVMYVGIQPTYDGLDQLNVLLPKSLKGAGVMDVTVTADGRPSNTATLYFQ